MIPCRQIGVLLLSTSGLLPSVSANVYSLVEKSPFIPPNFSPPSNRVPPRTAQQQENDYSYQGVYQIGDAFFFNIYSRSENKGQWVRSDSEDGSGIRILDYDLKEDAVEIEVDGVAINLDMVETSNTSMPVATRPASAPQTPRVTRPAAATPATEPTTNRPVRRRVIRPSSRNNSTQTTARRPVVRQ